MPKGHTLTWVGTTEEGVGLHLNSCARYTMLSNYSGPRHIRLRWDIARTPAIQNTVVRDLDSLIEYKHT